MADDVDVRVQARQLCGKVEGDLCPHKVEHYVGTCAVGQLAYHVHGLGVRRQRVVCPAAQRQLSALLADVQGHHGGRGHEPQQLDTDVSQPACRR